ncbi:hypothetical protein QUF58_08170 [Anaerolineales bacterium HSG24]|nr:hypothetical protein [Anaerolineales bacterium HSG24]
MTESTIQIKITYKRWQDEALQTVELTPDQYFDPLEEDETYYEDGIARYNSSWEYLPHVPVDELQWTFKEISGTNEDSTFYTEYQKNGRDNWMTHRVDHDGHEEIILSTDISNRIGHTIRLHKNEAGQWTVNTNMVHYDSATPDEWWESFVRKSS